MAKTVEAVLSMMEFGQLTKKPSKPAKKTVLAVFVSI